MVRPRIEVTVSSEHAGQRLMEVVAAYADVAHDAARDLVERGAVWINRYRAQQVDAQVAPGTQLVIHFPPRGEYDTVTITPADILWEDDVLLALNKRPGWHANYTPWDVRGSVPYALAAFVRARDGRDVPLHLAHQLDRDTSGVLLVSKDPAINPALQRLFLTGGMSKTYLALAAGALETDAVEIETGHGRGRHGLFLVYPLEDVGRELPFGAQRVRRMHTRFEVIERRAEATLVRAEPITGRTHQIRLHLVHLGHPIVGDARYGGALALHDTPITHHLLHAARLAFTHPRTQAPLTLAAPLPPLWNTVLSLLDMQHY